MAVEQASATGAYVGDELDLFAQAAHWKRYWSARIGRRVTGRVLDVGAGLGATARVFARHTGIESYLAVEPDPELAAAIAQLPQAQVPTAFEARCGTLAQVDGAARFDTILYIDVLEHIEDDRGELERAATHLSDEGRIVVLAPAHQFLYSPFDAAVGHFRRYDRATLRAALPSSLRVERMEYLDSVGLLASLANRLVLRSALPTRAQIALWDGWMVPASRFVDVLLMRRAGKSIVAVLRKAAS
jgi:SAM-dependent methyltransferase